MRPGPRLFRLSLAGLVCAPVVAGCKPTQQPPPPAPAPPIVQPTTLPPQAPSALDRARLLQAVDLAASSYTSGQTRAGEDVAGRRFVLRQAFGCQGPALTATPGLAQWTWGRDRRSIEISLAPADWSRDPLFSTADSPWEAVEGFWIARPWMRDAGCPAPPTGTTKDAEAATTDRAAEPDAATPPIDPTTPAHPAAPAPQVAGLASVFEAGGSRVGRRDGKAFALTQRAETGVVLVAPARGFRLVIEGRLGAFPSGQAIRCRAPSADTRPVCVAAAEVDRVAFEDADGRVLREWRPG
ncbi:MAG: hypothetical protein KKE02_20630 [Alphaproteobacteria bacterium]|nr:hypothetical protein [Alphaproteobacteria bacterium]MBU1514559.1 hypothetical protein [Alphaproteobacteria bacterium]MBU2096809.1 hypothetical protein [Alphaproteobacteria bacterium]MBU2153436.1 hypothetical protein [Alphaproteobacteria bacterium]MBU2306059.1 hypothetical protein [Alphaproteobacteria bacterium]